MIGEHQNVVLQFSGGADSTALLHLARPWLDRIVVLFGDTGAMFPHVRDHVIQTCRKFGADLRIVRPEIPVGRWHLDRGLPSDIVPGWHTAEMAWLEKDGRRQLIQPTFACCWQSLWKPMMDAVYSSGATLVLRASRRSDERPGIGPGSVINGVEYLMPLWEWSDSDVIDYLRDQHVLLPKQYAHIHDSLDCWLCTGHTGERGALTRYDYIKAHHPDLWAELAPRLRAVRRVIAAEASRHDLVFAAAENQTDGQ